MFHVSCLNISPANGSRFQNTNSACLLARMATSCVSSFLTQSGPSLEVITEYRAYSRNRVKQKELSVICSIHVLKEERYVICF